MAKTLEEYQKLLNKKKAEEQQLIGQETMYLRQLKEEGYNSLEQAEEELAKLTKEISEVEKKLVASKESFVEKYGEFLDG